MHTRVAAGCAAALAAAAACGTPPQESSPGAPADVRTPVPAALLEGIRADAARRLQVAAGELAVRNAEAVVWSDGALGCAAPGEMVTQALTPGYLVVLGAGSRLIEYRASERGYFRLCDATGAQPPLPAGVMRE